MFTLHLPNSIYALRKVDCSVACYGLPQPVLPTALLNTVPGIIVSVCKSTPAAFCKNRTLFIETRF